MKRTTLVFLSLIVLLAAACSERPESQWKAYVPQFSMPYGQSRVLVYTVPDLDLLGQAQAGTVACRIAARPASDEIWVSCEGSNEVGVVDARSDSLLGRIQMGLHTHGSAFSPDGSLFLVTHTAVVVHEEKSPTVSLLDAESRELLGSIEVGGDPRGACFDPRGRFAYVANMDDDTISVIDLDSLKVAATVTTGPAPHDLSVDPTGEFLFAACVGARLPDGSGRGQGKVILHHMPSLLEVTRFEAGPHPSRVSFLPDGDLVVSQLGSPRSKDSDPVLIFDKGEGARYRLDGELDLGHNPQFGAVSPDGRWYVVVVDGKDLVVADLDSRKEHARRELDGARANRYAAEILLRPADPAGN